MTFLLLVVLILLGTGWFMSALRNASLRTENDVLTEDLRRWRYGQLSGGER